MPPLTTPVDPHRRFAVAPMMELTDRHFRYLARLLTRHALLYSEMVTSAAVVHGDQSYLLGKLPCEEPVVLQLGGSDPQQMADASSIGEHFGYNEININVGCPSDRVRSGRFGACLMAEPALVARCVRAMQDAVTVPVSVKCRLGIDRDDSYEQLEQFARTVIEDGGCRILTVHARKAWLDGLSPKQNRSVPPLRYEHVYRLKQQFPAVHISINGGIDDWKSIEQHLQHVDGVMLGRQAYHHPAFLAEVDERLYAHLNTARNTLQSDIQSTLQSNAQSDSQINPPIVIAELHRTADDLHAVARDYALYMQTQIERGVRLSSMSRHAIALFQGVPGARRWRQHLSEQAGRTNDAVVLVDDALDCLGA